MLTINKMNTIVSDLNEEIYDKIGDDELQIELLSLGYIQIIKFAGVNIWNSADDPRDEIYEDIYEELDIYLRREINRIAVDLATLHI